MRTLLVIAHQLSPIVELKTIGGLYNDQIVGLQHTKKLSEMEAYLWHLILTSGEKERLLESAVDFRDRGQASP